MAVGKSAPLCPEGSVFALKAYFELIAEAERIEKMKKPPTKTKQDNHNFWLNTFREKRLQAEIIRITETGAPPHECQSWLDIYREKRVKFDEERRLYQKNQKNQQSEDHKLDLQNRILGLIERYTTLTELLDQALNQQANKSMDDQALEENTKLSCIDWFLRNEEGKQTKEN